jgi:prolipoprotein diacylglyceryltransferase
MRPVVVAWMVRNGLPDWLLPNYWELAAIAALIGSIIALRIAVWDRASVAHTARAIACAYVGALVGGYLFEAVRAIPAAVLACSWLPVLHPGRAAYGGLICAIGAAALYLRRAKEPVAPFLDRVAIGAGITFALVRTGCFLAGCDYGLPTSLPWGVRFPHGSLAALDHARRGFVPHGAASLPVHPTQLYEAAVGLVGAALAAVPLARGRRDGRAFATFLSVYAIGRFAIELVRGDQDRGALLGLSTAQWVSLAIGAALIVWRRRARPAQSVGDLSVVGTALANRSAKNSAGRACAGSIEKSGTPAGARSFV